MPRHTTPGNLDEPASSISWIGTVQIWPTFFVGAFSGRLLDAGYYVPTLIVGAIIQLLGIFMMSLSKTYWQLMLTQGIMTGLGGGIYFTPSLGIVASYFDKHRAFALGLATVGNATGGAIYPILVRELLPRLGFAWTTRCIGFFNLGLLALVIAFMRPRLPPRKSGPIIDWSAFREPPYAYFVGALFIINWAVYYVYYYVGSFGVEKVGLSYSGSTLLIVVINVVGIPARLIPPYFADKTGPLNIVAPAVACLVVVTLSWLAVSSVTGLYVFTVFYGFVNAAFQCLIPSTVASLTPNMNMVGTRLGMAFSTLSLAALTGPPIGGALQSATGGSYTAATIWAAASTLICAGLMVAARVSKVGWQWEKKC